MASTILTVLHTAQAAFSAYTLYLSSISIQNLQTYDESSKTAAKYSNIAADQRSKTQTTQAAGTIAIILSLGSSVYFATFGAGRAMSLVAGGNLIVLELARRYMGEFWKGKAKLPVPGLGEHNKAIGKTREVRLNMAYLMASWAGVGALALLNL